MTFLQPEADGARPYAVAVGTPIRIAVAALVRDGLVLMAHRSPWREAYPDSWALIGGHVERGESALQTVGRESVEEIGVRIHDPVPVPMTVSASAIEMHAFVVTRWTGEPANLAAEEHDDLRWFRPTELTSVRMAHPESLPSIANAVRLADEGGRRPG